jgi:hypothetical protein
LRRSTEKPDAAFFFCNGLFAAGVIDAFFGSQLIGKHTSTSGAWPVTTDVEPGASFGADIGFLVSHIAEVGFGFMVQIGRSHTLDPDNFNFDDLFVSCRIPISRGPATMYCVGRVGYGFFFADPSL